MYPLSQNLLTQLELEKKIKSIMSLKHKASERHCVLPIFVCLFPSSMLISKTALFEVRDIYASL